LRGTYPPNEETRNGHKHNGFQVWRRRRGADAKVTYRKVDFGKCSSTFVAICR
jgi:hypothetical protein